MQNQENREAADARIPTLLVVDDNPMNLSILYHYFEDYGFEIVEANDGESALKSVRTHLPDLILLDILMPGIDGLEVCRRLKADTALKHIPVIFMTSLTDTEDKIRGFRAGAVDYITKPFQHEEIVARVDAHLRISNLTRSLQEKNTQLKSLANTLARRAEHLEISSEVGRRITSILNLRQLLEAVTSLIQSRFGFYFTGIWLLSDTQDTMVLESFSGQGSDEMIGKTFSVTADAPTTILLHVYRTGETYLAQDIRSDPYYHENSDLPEARSELIIPLRVGQEVIGALDIISAKVRGLADDDQKVLQALGDQIAIAIHNARLYQREKKLRHMEQEKVTALAELNASKDKFFSIFSHDLRNPFSLLVTTAQVLLMNLDKQNKTQIRKKAQTIFDAAKSTMTLLDNLSTWSRIQRGHMKLKPNAFPLRDLIQNSINLLSENAAAKKIAVTNTIPPDLTVCADKYMVDMIVRNLTGNAIKFTPRNGQVTVSAEPFPYPETDLETGRSDREWVRVSIMDTGIGIDDDAMTKLFKIDVHHTTLGTANEQGTGLGLILCKEMVEMHHGTIDVESRVGQGSTFRFTVPGEKTC